MFLCPHALSPILCRGNPWAGQVGNPPRRRWEKMMIQAERQASTKAQRQARAQPWWGSDGGGESQPSRVTLLAHPAIPGFCFPLSPQMPAVSLEPWEPARETHPPAQSAGLSKLKHTLQLRVPDSASSGSLPCSLPSGSRRTPWGAPPSRNKKAEVKQEKARQK